MTDGYRRGYGNVFWTGTLVMTAKVTLKDYNVVNLLTVGILLILFRNQPVAQASRLCRRRLKPAATINGLLIATRYESMGRMAVGGLVG